MSKFTRIDKSAAVEIRGIIESSLKDALARHGLSLSSGNAVFDGGSITFKNFKIEVVDKAPGVTTIEDQQLTGMMRLFGLTKKEAGHLKLVSYRPRATKKPWVVLDSRDGKQYVYPNALVEQLFR